MDEEPPHPLNMEALKIALRVARALKSDIIDEIHVMRKIVIDGSNTTGFQRTCLVAVNGEITVNGKKVPIQTICLEEDAARLIDKSERESVFALDRLGIPLIEIATAPVITSPDEAVKVALEIGRIVKATGYVRNELGVIRQDVNISVRGGGLVEVKGVQRLSQLKRVVEFEAIRQSSLTKIALELKRRGVKESDLKNEIIDVTEVFKETKCGIIRKSLKTGKRVYAVKLTGFNGLLGLETAPGYRLGKEMAERVRFWTDVRGLFHTDEMPSYGISEEEINELRKRVSANKLDAVVFLAASEDQARRALEKVIERAIEALYGPPSETRGSKEDGTTFYMRPRPGMARMYPETDIPPIKITEELLREIDAKPIIPPRVKVAELMRLGLSEQLSWEVYDSKYYDLFLRLTKEISTLKPTFIASTLTETMKNLEREGFHVDKIPDDKIYEAFMVVEKGLTAKESLAEIFKELSKNPHADILLLIREKGLGTISDKELESIVNEVITKNIDLIRQLGDRSFKQIMGRIMSKVRGRADPRKVADLVRKKLKEI